MTLVVLRCLRPMVCFSSFFYFFYLGGVKVFFDNISLWQAAAAAGSGSHGGGEAVCLLLELVYALLPTSCDQFPLALHLLHSLVKLKEGLKLR